MNIVQERPQQLEERTIDFAVSVISFCKGLPQSPENKIISNQLIRSATSIGANYTEANNAASRIDFRNKIYICKKEASESRYWLKVLTKTNSNLQTSELIDEISQLIFILQKIVSTMKIGKCKINEKCKK
ncbi:four helix bundle protein [Candidatus Saccharibacteria bacterium CG10_big_fil_rev_8_21_14_0_10_47_8]|nr:MAG: four helix bundle protein [Candidatus Saccharibacteria bacterium CG10_big_fil_rev_8_21_14_0_10_47_8]